MGTTSSPDTASSPNPASQSDPAEPRRVALGVGGGIAAYKAAEITRRLRSFDTVTTDVTVIPTANALKFVGAATFEALSGHPVTADVFADIPSVAHVHAGQHAALMIIAPATADLLARAAAGRADDLLTASLLVTRAPVMMVPAMHTEMWTHPATRANVATLRERGVIVIDPAVGRLTGADSGPGRLPEPDHVAQLAELLLHRPDALPRDLAGRRVVVTAGGTREPLDPVRFLGNRSSGRQGFAVALVAAARGAEVTLIAANTELAVPPGVDLVPVTTASEMREATRTAAARADAVVMSAAVADFRPATPLASKIKKGSAQASTTLALAENPDILAELTGARDESDHSVIVGFAAETGDRDHDVLDYGREKLARKRCDLLVVNDVSDGAVFSRAESSATILDRDGGEHPVPHGPKSLVAAAIGDRLAARLGHR